MNTPKLPPFDHPQVQTVYELLCSEEIGPVDEHWEGWTARRIVAAIEAQGVPDAIDSKGDSYSERAYAEGWNACRASMLASAPPAQQGVPDGWKLVPAEPNKEVRQCLEGKVGVDFLLAYADWRKPGEPPPPPAPQAKPQPLSDEQKQRIANETGAGHSLICLVESYIHGIKE